MRRLLLALALLLPSASWAATVCPPSMCAGNGYQTVHIADRKPIAVVYDSDVLANATDRATLMKAENQNLGRIWTQLREQGQEIHFYESRYFQGTWGTADSLPFHLWHHMGDVYSLVICIGFRAQYATDAAFTRRFFCPDSTNAKLLHWDILSFVNDYSGAAPSGQLGTGTALGTGLAGASNNATSSGGDGSNMAFLNARGDSLFSIGANIGRAVYNYPNQPYAPQTFTGNIFGSYQFRSDIGSGAFSTVGNWGRIVVTSSSGGTLPGTWFVQSHNDSVLFLQDSTGTIGPTTNGTCTVAVYKPDSTHYRVNKIVRLWTPTWDAGGKFRSTSNNVVRADSADVMGADSVARYMSEPLPIAWRVYWKPRSVDLSWLSDSPSTSRSVDYVAMTGQVGSYACTAQYAYALIARYAKLDKQRIAYEWDDHGTFGWDKADSTTGSNNYKTMWPQPDSLATYMAMLKSYGIASWETTGPADSLYLKATTVQGGKQYPWLRSGWQFVPHVHDTTEAHRLGMVLGLGSNSCGYSGNSVFHPRYAFRNDGSLALDQPLKYGIWNRLAAQDSAYRAYFGTGSLSPYLSFPNDYSATVSLRRQKVTLSGNRYVFSADCPAESLFAAYKATGKSIIRGFVDLQNPYDTTFVDATTRNIGVSPPYAMWQDTAATLTTRERFTTRYFSDADRVFRGTLPAALAQYGDNPNGTYAVRCVGTIAASQTGAQIISASGAYPYTYQFRQAATAVVPTLLGLWYSPPRIGLPRVDLGEAALNGSFTLAKIFRYSQDTGRVRMFYQHPGSSQFATGSPWARFNPEKEIARVNVLSNIRALEGQAGYQLVQWVKPWEVFDR